MVVGRVNIARTNLGTTGAKRAPMALLPRGVDTELCTLVSIN